LTLRNFKKILTASQPWHPDENIFPSVTSWWKV